MKIMGDWAWTSCTLIAIYIFYNVNSILCKLIIHVYKKMKDCMFFKLSDKDLILYCHFDYVLSCMRGVNKFMKTLNFDTNTQQLMKNFKTGFLFFRKEKWKECGTCSSNRKIELKLLSWKLDLVYLFLFKYIMYYWDMSACVYTCT